MSSTVADTGHGNWVEDGDRDENGAYFAIYETCMSHVRTSKYDMEAFKVVIKVSNEMRYEREVAIREVVCEVV